MELKQGLEKLKSSVKLRSTYDNFIGGEWVKPVDGQYFDNISPINGHPVCRVAQSQAADIEVALDAAHKAKDKWASTPIAQRAAMLEKIAEASSGCTRFDQNFGSSRISHGA